MNSKRLAHAHLWLSLPLGSVLLLTACASATPETGPQTYTVQAGDNLFRIALKHQITVDALRMANGLTGDVIYVGQVLVIPVTNGTWVAPPTALAPQVTQLPPQPAIGWDASGTFRVVESYNEFFATDPNFIPNAVYGDGHIIWVADAGRSGGRAVFEGWLSTDQMRELLQRFVSVGFFGWAEKYGRESLSQSAEHVQVRLTTVTQAVTVYDTDSTRPAEFDALAVTLRTGNALSSDHLYRPVRAYLTARVADPSPTAVEWPNFPLDQLGAGRYIDGATLEWAWNHVNATFPTPVVNSNGQTYRIALQIPFVSFYQPPAE